MTVHARFLTLAAGLLLAGAGPVLAKPAAPSPEASMRRFYLEMIEQARSDGRSRAALAFLDSYDIKYPADTEARLLRINCLLDLGQVDEAEHVLATLDAPASGNLAASISAIHGHVLAARGQWAQAVPYYEAAVAAAPSSALTRNALGYSLLRDHHPDRAVEALRNAYDLAPGNPTIRNNLLLAYAVSGQTDLLNRGLESLPEATSASLRPQIAAEVARIAAAPAPAPAVATASPAALPASAEAAPAHPAPAALRKAS